MKLNADIIFNDIKEFTNAEISGPHTKDLALCRPEFYLDGSKAFLTNHCYVASADHLPSRPVIENDVVLVVLGDSVKTTMFKDRCCLITVSDEIGIFCLFNTIQSIFAKYGEWEETLHETLNNFSGISELLECSTKIFGNPLGVIDKNFKYIGLANQETVSDYLKTNVSDNRNLDPDLLRRFLNKHELSTMSVHEPLFLDIENYKTMNLNLFDGDNYIGCLTIWNALREFRVCDAVLARYLRGILELAIKKYAYENTFDKTVVKQVLKDAIDGLPSNYDNIRRVKALKNDREYVCAKIEISTHLSNLPVGYVCSNVEDSFPKSLVLEHHHNVVAFIDIDGLKDAEGCYLDTLKQRMLQLAESMGLHVGLSGSFTDIFSSRLYYLQAHAALSNGRTINQSERVFDFQDYALNELVINALGELPIELFYFDGLKRLFAHDAESQASYTDTLKVYLNNNMSITKTASDLFIHRSTLIERMARIERDLDVDLKNPDMQLLIRILLKAQEINGQLTRKSP